VRNIEDQFAAGGSQLVYVLSENSGFGASNADDSQAYWSDRIGSSTGIRVGDGDTQPSARTFDASPFITSNRGFVMVVRRSDMVITFASNYNAQPAAELLEHATNAPAP
jgi:hypothetical protein